MLWYFLFFLLSGFCGILYELVWLRLAMAQFGVTTPLISTVLSMFMAGLGLGSWIAGTLVRHYEGRTQVPPLRLYALCEFLIGLSSIVVPVQFLWGHRILERLSGQNGISSSAFYLVAGAWLALTLIPWCACMGATIPLAMFAIRHSGNAASKRSFSFLYVANLVGAVAGALIPLLFIELFGFHATLRVGMTLNFLVAISAYLLSLTSQPSSVPDAAVPAQPDSAGPSSFKGILSLLFLTGLITMGMEVIWIRLFTPTVGPMVYSFALILASYLFATFAGSRFYRFWSHRSSSETPLLWVFLALVAFLPLVTSDVRWNLQATTRVFLGVMPISFLMGFLTPMLVDRWSQGDPGRAGRAYAVNVLGCILGPLLSGFILLPLLGERVSMLLFALPFAAMAFWPAGGVKLATSDRVAGYAVVAVAFLLFFTTRDFESLFEHHRVLRDSAATVIAAESSPAPEDKQLMVNGIVMTGLNPITKMMAHLTFASHEPGPPKNALVICFGMGTTFRSGLTWDIPVTVVDLIPSVPKMFSYFHADAAQVQANPNARIIVDDGRRFLERTSQTFDIIIVDPPPPVPAAGSSLLYSKEFYVLVKQHLNPNGIFQQWIPGGDFYTYSAVARSLKESFPYVSVFAYTGNPGLHFLCSMSPIPDLSTAELTARTPAKAQVDLVEWGPYHKPVEEFGILRPKGYALDKLIALSPSAPALQDDRPVNEYFFLRTPCKDCGLGIEFVRRQLSAGFARFLQPATVSAATR